jgi:outer membrane lipoprotein-sorting protein
MIALACAALTIAAVCLFVPSGQSTVLAFDDIANKLMEAKSARYQSEATIEAVPGADAVTQSFQSYYLAPGLFRNEFRSPEMATITDSVSGKMLFLTRASKSAVLIMKGAKGDEKHPNHFERLRTLLSKQGTQQGAEYESLGEKEIDGHRAVGFRYDSPLAVITLWGDKTTGQPVLVETVWSGTPRTEVKMSKFEINVPLNCKRLKTTLRSRANKL